MLKGLIGSDRNLRESPSRESSSIRPEQVSPKLAWAQDTVSLTRCHSYILLRVSLQSGTDEGKGFCGLCRGGAGALLAVQGLRRGV